MSWETLVEQSLKENRPKMYAEMQTQGPEQVKLFAKKQADRATKVWCRMVEQGSRPNEAREVVMRDYLLFPSEKDQPSLGEQAESFEND